MSSPGEIGRVMNKIQELNDRFLKNPFNGGGKLSVTRKGDRGDQEPRQKQAGRK